MENCTAITLTGQGCAAERVTEGVLVLEIVDRLGVPVSLATGILPVRLRHQRTRDAGF